MAAVRTSPVSCRHHNQSHSLAHSNQQQLTRSAPVPLGSAMAGRACWRSLAVVVAVVGAAAATAVAEPQVPCYFVFGDSLVDNGNNNGIVSLARANYPPYGVDFAGGPTGRFSNGLTTVDVISQLLGFDDFIPPFAGATSDQLLTGVNFASAAAGIREETGQQLVRAPPSPRPRSPANKLDQEFKTYVRTYVNGAACMQGGRISFSGQVQNYQSAVEQLVSIMGDEGAAANRLSQCIFTVGMGSNDYLNNYFMPAFYDTGSRYTPTQYADDLAARYTQLLRALYSYGARKVALIGVGQVGCSPNELATQSANGVACVDRINVAVRMFNQRLVGMVDQFNRLLPGAHFTYINIDGIFSDILRAPGGHGLRVTNRGCCGVGRNNGQVTCLPFQTPCPNRNEYLFWDAFHPTEAANVLVGQRAYAARLASDVHPVDISTLAHL
uniref:GDSL esterase/lipase n=1 Tax=Hordeum vulgare subsp. vulgare TaxID=112509 RepID=A0A8I6WSS7_HORVV